MRKRKVIAPITPEKAVYRAAELACQLKHDRVSLVEWKGQPTVMVLRAPVDSYKYRVSDKRFEQRIVCVPLERTMTQREFDIEIRDAVKVLDAALEAHFPGNRKARTSMIRKVAH